MLTFTLCLLMNAGSVFTSASPNLRVHKSWRHIHRSVRTKRHSPKQMMPAMCSWNSGSSAVSSTKFKFNTFFMYKSSALKSSIQLMRVERNHVPYGNYDNYFLWSTSSYCHNSRNTWHEHYGNHLNVILDHFHTHIHHRFYICTITTPPGLNRDTSELLCPLGFTSSVLNVVMVQRWASCHQLIQTGELLRGRKYHIVMRWRPDIRPLTPFPSLDDLVWASVVPKHIIIPGYLRYFGSTAVQVPNTRPAHSIF